MENSLSHLHQFIDTSFDLDDLRSLCFELGVDFDNLPGDIKTTKVQALLLALGRRRQLDRLLNALRKERPEAFEQAGLGSDPETLEALYAALPAFGPNATPSVHLTILGDVSGQLAIGSDIAQAMGATPRLPLQRPPRAQHFTGREAELAQLLAELQPGRVVTLSGPGGIGKTALAAEAIWQLAPADQPPERFPHGVLFHTFYGQPEATLACEHIARSFGEDPGGGSPRDAARRALAGRQALLVLDGAENADDLAAVLALRGECGALVTSRARHDAPQDWQAVAPLPNAEALALLRAWAGRWADDEAAARRICTLVGALPLALRLVGRYMAQQEEPASDYVAWLESTPLAALHFGDRQGESAPLLLQRSVAELSAGAQVALEAIGVLAMASFGRAAPAAALEVTPAEAGRRLGEWVDYGLLLREEGRYRVSHSLVHTFARERGAPAGPFLTRLAAYYEGLVWEQSERGREGYAALDAERPHVLALLEACKAAREWESVLRLVKAIDSYLDRQGHWTDREAAVEARLAAAQALARPQDEAAALNGLGNVHARRGDWVRAIEMYQRSLETYERVGDVHGMAQTFNNLGIVYRRKGEWEQAIEYYKKNLAFSERTEDVHGMANTWNNLGLVYADQGDWERAIDMFELSLETYERVGDVHGMAQTFNNLGIVYRRKEEWEQAIEMYQRSLEAKERLEDVHGMAQTFNNLGLVYAGRGEWEQAIEMYRRSLEIKARVEDVHGMAGTWNNVGSVYARRGEWERAIEMYQGSLETYERMGDVYGMAITRTNLGEACAELGQVERARDYLERALAVFEKLGSPHAEQALELLAALKAASTPNDG